MMANISPLEQYRSGVGLVLIQDDGRVWVGKRIQKPFHIFPMNHWQWPQGGIEEGETPENALLREMQEEIGTQDFCILACTDWITYIFPDDVQSRVYNGRYKGQSHLWFAARSSPRTQIQIHTAHPEFSEGTWMLPRTVVEQSVAFKRDAYEQVYASFQKFF